MYRWYVLHKRIEERSGALFGEHTLPVVATFRTSVEGSAIVPAERLLTMLVRRLEGRTKVEVVAYECCQDKKHEGAE